MSEIRFIVFMQGEEYEEADRQADLTDDWDYGMVEYMSQWSNEEDALVEELGHGEEDQVRYLRDGFVLTFNRRIGYASLYRMEG